MLYLFEVRWRIVERFTSNAEYAMLLVYVLMIKMDFKKWCTSKLFVFVCYLLCHVLRLPYLLIIPVSHHDLIWLLAFLRNRFWWKENSNSQSKSWYHSLYSCVHNSFTLCFILHCVWSSSWKHVIWEKLEYCLLLEHRYIWSPFSPTLPQHQMLSSLFLFIENKSLMCGCTVLISIQYGLWKPLLTISLEIDKRNSSGWVVENLLSLFDH